MAGLGLLPQAGVAMGMALLAAERYPAAAADLLAVAVAATIFFEIVGPVLHPAPASDEAA